jgi:hypothetical protein
MESVNEIKEQLSARSRTATLDELANEGRKRVRLIRAEHIAQMVSEAVHAAVEESGLLDRDAVDALVEKSRAEFRTVLREREQELEVARENEAQLEASERDFEALQARFQALTQELALANSELQAVQDELETARREAQSAAEAQPAVPADVMRSMIQELAEVKASVAQQPPSDQESAPGGADLESNMDNIKVKQKAAGGIAANLAKLKKLKGGG